MFEASFVAQKCCLIRRLFIGKQGSFYRRVTLGTCKIVHLACVRGRAVTMISWSHIGLEWKRHPNQHNHLVLLKLSFWHTITSLFWNLKKSLRSGISNFCTFGFEFSQKWNENAEIKISNNNSHRLQKKYARDLYLGMTNGWCRSLVIVQYLDRTNSFINFKNQNRLISPPPSRRGMIDSLGDRGYNNRGVTSVARLN